MKKILLGALILFTISPRSFAQREIDHPTEGDKHFPYMGFSDVTFPIAIPGKDYSLSTLIDGQNISGTPFMADDWRKGTILLKNGALYENYKLKYDIYHQELLFLTKGKEMVVTDPVQEFIIADDKGDLHHFINADMYKNLDHQQFYEILLIENRGHLLKANSMTIANSDEIANAKVNKYLKPREAYYYYDKATGITRQFNFSSTSVEKALQLTPEQENALSFPGYHFNDESDIMKFFRVYLQS